MTEGFFAAHWHALMEAIAEHNGHSHPEEWAGGVVKRFEDKLAKVGIAGPDPGHPAVEAAAEQPGPVEAPKESQDHATS